MEAASREDVTKWLRAWSAGDESALEKLIPLVYGELRLRARRLMGRERDGHSLRPTALIHEAYLRFLGSKTVDLRDRSHFYALASRLMRQILVDHARSRGRRKRGGAALPLVFDETVMGQPERSDLVQLDDALNALAQTDDRKSRVVELRFFGGLSVEETADVLSISPQTVLRDWKLAKAWLQREMKRGTVPEGSRWEALERIYHQAVERPLAERNAFLESACAGDDALRRELESLLANEGPSFLEKSALGVAARDMHLTASWIGRRIGGYEVLALLGAGGMGEVYRARDISLGREVALKLLPREVARDPDRLNRLHREARLLASLNHHRIATLYGLEESDGQRFLVMELVLGQTLAERLRHGALPVREALEVSRQIAEGLEAAHEAGIVHRDLKPANIKVTPDGRVKLLDFGLAKALAPSSGIEPTQLTDTATRAGTVLGTAAYMSPEQARGQTVDRRTDVWAFGCCLYECLTGQRAFSGDTFTDTLAAILDRDPKWSVLSGSVPDGVRRLLRRCLAKDVGKRLQHIGDARLELEETDDDRAERPAHSRWPRYAIWVTCAAVLIAVAAGLTSWLGRRRTIVVNNDAVVRLTLNLRGDMASDPGLVVGSFFTPFALSPDGGRVVFRTRSVQSSELILRELSGFDVRALPGTKTATTPFFSPDGRWVGFWRAEDRHLRKVSIDGGFAC